MTMLVRISVMVYSCWVWLDWRDTMGVSVAGLASAFFMSIRLARMRSSVEAIGVLILVGNQCTVSQVRTDLVSCIQLLYHL